MSTECECVKCDIMHRGPPCIVAALCLVSSIHIVTIVPWKGIIYAAGEQSSAAQPPVPLFSHYSATALLALIINIFKQHFILCHPSFLVSFVSGEFDKYVVQHALMIHTCM